MQLSRRQFLATSGGMAVAMGLPAWLPSVVYADDDCTTRDVIVCIFLRGAADGLTLCVPHGEDAYYASRSTIAIPRPDASGDFKAIDLDGFFGLPPQLGALIPAYQNGHLLLVHASGSTDPTRSHFDGQRYMEVGKPGDVNLFTGWLGRHLSTVAPMVPNPVLRGIGIGFGLQRSLQSAPQTIPIPDLDKFNLAGSAATQAARQSTISAMHALFDNALSAAATTAQQTISYLDAIDFAGYVPAGGAIYPSHPFGYSLKSTAALIKADVGVEAVAIDLGGWDTHIQQVVTPGGGMSNNMERLGNALGAFYADLFSGPRRNVTVVVMSEFGRRLLENGSRGTDHGHGNVMFVMGNDIDGGRVMTQWPGLQPDQLFEGRDLAVTIDFRDVLAEIVQYRLGNTNLESVFPGYTPTFRGVTRSCDDESNCDGAIQAGDVERLTQALTDPAAFMAQNPGCPLSTADLNNDGVVNALDLEAFVRQMLD